MVDVIIGESAKNIAGFRLKLKADNRPVVLEQSISALEVRTGKDGRVLGKLLLALVCTLDIEVQALWAILGPAEFTGVDPLQQRRFADDF